MNFGKSNINIVSPFLGLEVIFILFSLTSFWSMYAYLEGIYTFKSPALVHLFVHGVGYEVHISLNTYSEIQSLEKGKLFTHLQVKEDSHTLFGFASQREKDTFVQLISVSGVGATIARMMLSSLQADEIATAIIQGNVGLLERIKGIGKKTAQRLVLELKDKMGKGEISLPGAPQKLNTIQEDAFIALIALGINKNQAEQAVQKVIRTEPDIVHLEELIKKALKAI